MIKSQRLQVLSASELFFANPIHNIKHGRTESSTRRRGRSHLWRGFALDGCCDGEVDPTNGTCNC